MTPEQWRDAVGVQVERARGRTSVRQAAKRAGISEGLWRQIESGRRMVKPGEYVTVSPRPQTLAQVSLSLGWTEDSIDRILAGETPVSPPRSEADDRWVSRERFDLLQAQVEALLEQVARLDADVALLTSAARRDVR